MNKSWIKQYWTKTKESINITTSDKKIEIKPDKSDEWTIYQYDERKPIPVEKQLVILEIKTREESFIAIKDFKSKEYNKFYDFLHNHK